MLYDLNIAWSPSSPTAELERTLNFAKYLGYDVVALNHSVSAPISGILENIVGLSSSSG